MEAGGGVCTPHFFFLTFLCFYCIELPLSNALTPHLQIHGTALAHTPSFSVVHPIKMCYYYQTWHVAQHEEDRGGQESWQKNIERMLPGNCFHN